MLAAALIALSALFRFYLWPQVSSLIDGSPDAFARAFAQLIAREEIVLFPLGMLTAVAALIVLFQRGVDSPRGRLQLVAVAALIASAIVMTSITGPVAKSITAGGEAALSAAGQSAPSASAQAALTALVARWSRWQWVNFACAMIAGVALLGAQRLPVTTMRASVLDSHHRRLLLLLGVATLFEGYDRFIISLALPYIGRDLGATEAHLGYALSLIRIGALLSIALGWGADRFGRRRVLLLTVLAYTVATAATGFSRTIVAFVAFQLFATIFLIAELALAQVVVAEEFPAGYRGRAQGLLGAFGALGSGLAAMLFPLFERTPLGWRGLYFVGLLPLLFVAYLRRGLPETKRWSELSATPDYRQGLAELFGPELRARFLVLNTVAACAALAASPAFAFASFHATRTFHWSAAEVSAMIIAGGAVGMSGWFVFGKGADVLGRRTSGAVAMVLGGVAAVAFYQTGALVPAFAALVFTEAGVAIALNALGTELFPTHLRATAKSWVTNAGILGAMAGLAIVGLLSERAGGAAAVISLLAIVPMLTTPLLFVVRETRGEELETTSG